IGRDAPGGFNAIKTRHLYVHEHDIRPQSAGQLDGRRAVGGLADDFQVVLGVEQRPESGPHQRLVVGEQDPDHAGPSSAPSGKVARTAKPPASLGAACSAPPSPVTRSRMPRRPTPGVTGRAGDAWPSSVTETVSTAGAYSTRIWAVAGPACRATLVRASWT